MQDNLLYILDKQDSIANHFIAELRKKGFQQDRMRFRTNLIRIGEILAYELSKELPYAEERIKTPLAETKANLLASHPVLISVMRAGLPLHQGVLNYFDQSDNGFVGAFRDHTQSESQFEIAMQYFAIPPTTDKHVILIDPMLASGKTLVSVSQQISKHGEPEHLHILAAIASPEGIEHLRKELDTPFSLWIGAVDDHLNDKAYIVPGLGDAGDLAFGEKTN